MGQQQAVQSALQEAREDVRVAMAAATTLRQRLEALRERVQKLPDGEYRRLVEMELRGAETYAALAQGETRWSGLSYVERLLNSAASGHEWGEVEKQQERNLGCDRG